MSFSRLLLSKATRIGAARPVQQQSFAAARSLSTKEVFSNGDLVNAIAAEHDISKAETRRIVASVFDSIVEACANDKKVSISKFGTFEATHQKAREGRNPKTGDTILIPAKERVRFSAFTAFKDTVNKKI